MPVNGSDPQTDHFLQLAAAQRHQQEILGQALQNALQNPHTVKRAQICLVGINTSEGTLLVALPTGERWDVPLNKDIADAIRRGLDQIEAAAPNS